MLTTHLKPTPVSRRDRLKAATSPDHKRLDALVSAQQFFTSQNRYSIWLQRSYVFQAAIERALNTARTTDFFPNYVAHAHLAFIAQDLHDLGLKEPPVQPAFDLQYRTQAACLGALYVVEGASMGARVLLIAAHRLGLNGERGARQLTAAASNIQHWRNYVAMLEAAPLTPVDETRMIAVARRTFAFAQQCFGTAQPDLP